MSRTSTIALFALLASAALAPRAAAQQFSLQRDFDLVRGTNGQPLQNVYWVSLPLDPVLVDDADPAARTFSKCSSDADGPPRGDGRIDSADLICAWWTARADRATAGSLTVRRWDATNCNWITTTGAFSPFGMTMFGPRFPVDGHVGYQVEVKVPPGATYSPRNPVLLEGDPDPSWTGTPLTFSMSCGPRQVRQQLLAFPYDAAYTGADEILCGLEGVDWFDVLPAGGDGKPDACWDDLDGDQSFDVGEPLTGLYDGRHTIAVFDWLNIPSRNGPVGFSAAFVAIGSRVAFQAPSFPLSAGEAYMVTLNPGHESTWLPPTR